MEKTKTYVILSLGTLLIAVGIYFFEFPNSFSTGGVSGTAIIINRIFPLLSPTKIATVLNVVLLVIGFITMGKEFAFKTVYTSVLLLLILNLLEWFIPLSEPLTNQKFLELFLDMIFVSLGAALIFNEEGSSGGTDIIAMILKRQFNLSFGISILIVDFFVIVGAFSILGIELGLFSFFALVVRTLVIDTATESLKTSKFFIIITDKEKEITDFILKQLNRGATVLSDCKGVYENSPKRTIISVVSKKQAVLLKRKIKEIDSVAFTIIGTSSDIIGKGF